MADAGQALKASLRLALIAQYVSDRQQQFTSEVVSCFAIGIFDPMNRGGGATQAK
jgi:hypothetical protein